MNTLLADPPVLADPEQPSSEAPDASSPPGASPESPDSTQAAAGPTCAKCGAPMEPGQDWCLQCGAGAPGSLDAGGPSWRSAAAILTATAVLVLGAAAAAYAALNKGGAPKPHPTIVAVVPATTPTVTPTTTTPVTPTPTTPGAATPTPKTSGTTATNPLAPTGSATPPKIPLTAPTPKSTGTATTPAKAKETSPTSPTTTTPSSGNETGGGAATEPAPDALVLDPDAASTYNPYNYPASEFGDPSLAIDGDASTAWTALLNPAVAPKMAEGLAIDLKSPQRVSAVELITSTPGMSVQIYGANSQTLPTSITDPAWVQLSPYLVTKKRNERIKLKDSSKGFRFVTLWISKAPAGSVGTAQAPTHVSVNELELFPAK